MATLIPALSSCTQQMTSGERRLAQRLEQKLEEDYLLWYNVPVGPKQLRPDFILLHPGRGLFILEVKDWKLGTVQEANPYSVKLLTERGIQEVRNPLEQARGYALEIVQLLQADSILVHPEGRYQGKLVCPYAYGVVFTNITRRQFEAQEGLRDVFEPNLVICQDEFYESIDAGELQQRLWNLSHYDFGTTLSPTQVDRVRYHLFPEIRIGDQLSLFPETAPKWVDVQQEQLARSLGEGHRVIHGVAGSGKTLILAYRAQKLAEETTKPILVLCFNVSLASRLRWMMAEKGLSERVLVRHFHGWCAGQLREYRVPKPRWSNLSAQEYNEQVVQQVIQGIERGMIPPRRYGAVMVDEGHDFQPEWLKLVAQMVDPQTNSLLVLYDDAQNLYGQSKRQKFSFKSLGIRAQGRTTILKLNYRNTQEILEVAYAFAQEIMTTDETPEEDAPVLVQPQSAGRHGSLPQLIRLPNLQREAQYLVQKARHFHERGFSWNEMAVVYRSRFIGEQVYQQLQQVHIPVEWLNRDEDSRFYNPAENSMKLVTMHSSKGLEFPIVFIPGLGFLPHPQAEVAEEARLLYVAMTRAVNQLVMTCDRASDFMQRVEVALERARG